jgi:soluble lytic murein transglycosylase-like protein
MRNLFLTFLLLPVMAYGKPPPEVVRVARILAYPDFPTKKDILAICEIESSFRKYVVKVSKKGVPSNGVMQVENAPFEIWDNVSLGVARLREGYVMFHSREAAVKSYNIGSGNYSKGRAKISAEEYWRKFVKAKENLNGF